MNANNELPPSSTQSPPSWWLGLAVVWLVGFLLFFFTRPMPNLRGTFAETRAEAWEAVPLVVLDWIFPSGTPPSTSPLAPEMQSGWRFLPERLVLWGVAGFILAGAWGIGHLLLRWLVPKESLTSLERFVFACGVGLSVVSLLTLCCGVMGFLHRGFFAGIFGLSFLGALGDCLWSWRQTGKTESNPKPVANLHRWHWVIVGLLIPFLVMMLLGGVSPSTDFDVKEYHFGGPKEFFLAGRIQFLPHNVYTSFPFLTEMLTLQGMVLREDWLTGALVGKSVLMAFIPLTGLAILAAGRRWFGSWAGWLGMLIWLTTPWATRIAIIAYAEGGLTCYLFLAFFATVLAVQQFREGKLQPGLFLLAGLLAGSAMACKYTGLVSVVFPLAGLVAFVVARSKPKTESSIPRAQIWLRTIGVFGLGVTISIGPWLVKNLAETGNPVYPLAWSIFGGRDWNADLNAQWTRAHSPPHHRLSSLVILDNGAPGWLIDVMAINDWLSPLLYGLAPLVVLAPGFRKFGGKIWLYLAWLFLTWWALTHRLDRFWVPMLPLVALLAGAGAVWSSDRIWKIVCGTGIGLTLLFNFVLIGTQNAGYVAGLTKLEDAANFTARITAPELDTLNKLAAKSPGDIRVLSVGDAEVFDARFPVIYNTVFDRSIFQEWTETSDSDLPPDKRPMQSPEEIRETFRTEGITHVLVNWQEILRYRPTYGYAEYVTPERFEWLVDHGVLEKADVLNRREWDTLSASEQRELRKTGWREKLREPTAIGEPIILSAVYRVR